MKLFATVILSLWFTAACAAQARLPASMPENVAVYLNEGGGKTRAYKKITIDQGVLEFEELSGGSPTPQKWSSPVSRAELEKLYKAFVDNRFDTIRNDEPKGRAYDAGSERISISLDKLESFGVTHGKNSPLSGNDLKRYEAVRKALYNLLGQHDDARTTGESERFIRGTWRTGGETGGYSWFLEWTFENGKFKQLGYPPIVQEGRYKVLSAGEDQMTLELYDQKGTFGEERRELRVSIDKKADRLTIGGTKGFSRTTPE